ncbi:MAG: hypothetical protein GX566_04565 [Bacteroidales bacterium]|nr:hypothetical protein [Bacteroidales bacterium]NLF81750.1 hypothetical protein [Bacteroidales bacterium]
MNTKSLSVINIFLYLGMIIVNALANALPINGMTTGELSDNYTNLFVPAGITFSIWGVIYLLLLILVVYQVAAVYGKKSRYALNAKQNMAFALTCIFNAAWIITWHYQLIFWSVVVMLGLLLSLISLYNSLYNINIDSGMGKFAFRVSIGVYLGWISVATIANVTALLVSRNWDGFGLSENIWTIAVMIVGFILAVLVTLRNRDIFYPLVVIWAYYGIIIKRTADLIVHKDIVITAWVIIVLTALLIVYTLISSCASGKRKSLLCRG